ncbi:MAG: biosynthetic-type acetolactate synthase large subunit [Vampirovibrionales bacterium]|nr:biosynthetic-type acetolactate synthase large subunit [Vampirovibrionales bacterium]
MAASTASNVSHSSMMMTSSSQHAPTPMPPSLPTTSPKTASINIKPLHKSGAQWLLSTLAAQGVDTLFGMPGGVILPIYDNLHEFPQIRHILVRHEQGAGHMAEGYAKATGKVGVALATSGPGATNLITALTDAYYDSVPIVCITGNVPTFLLGSDAFQEADMVGMTRGCTKYNTMVRRIEDLVPALEEAFYIAASGRPGPVLVDIPKDVMTAMIAEDAIRHFTPSDLPGYAPEAANQYSGADIDTAIQLLLEAKQPVILAGGGVISANASVELRQLADQWQLPVASSLMGLGCFAADHPLYLGFCGMHGHVASNLAIANADVLLVVGNRLNERQTGNKAKFASNARIIHIDLDPTTLNKNVQAGLALQGDVKSVLQALIARTPLNTSDALFEKALNSRSTWMSKIDGFKARRKAPDEWPHGFLSPELVAQRLFQWLPQKAIITTEVGQHQMWAAQQYNLNTPRTWLTSGGLGTMGFGFPAALGAKVAKPDHLVVDIAGDGSFQMTLQELATATESNLPVVVAVMNNAHLGMIRQWQGRMFERESQAAMFGPDYLKLAEAYGARGFVVEHPDQIDAVIQEAYHVGMTQTVIIDFRVHAKSDVYPWVPGGAANADMLQSPACAWPGAKQTQSGGA